MFPSVREPVFPTSAKRPKLQGELPMKAMNHLRCPPHRWRYLPVCVHQQEFLQRRRNTKVEKNFPVVTLRWNVLQVLFVVEAVQQFLTRWYEARRDAMRNDLNILQGLSFRQCFQPSVYDRILAIDDGAEIYILIDATALEKEGVQCN